MSTVYLEVPVDTDEVIDNVHASDEWDFLLDALERFNPKNINAALREYFRSQKERGAALPDFVDAEKL